MRAIIIENDYETPIELEKFIEKNPGMFDHVDRQLFCKNRTVNDISRYLLAADAILVKSTFLDKIQLEDFIKIIGSGVMDIKIMMIWNVVPDLNDWLRNPNDSDFLEPDITNGSIRTFVDKGILFSIRSDYKHYKVQYNEELNIYFEDGFRSAEQALEHYERYNS